MPTPPCDLSRHFAHTTILASAGITVKGVTPEVTTCPFCGNESFSVLLDPIAIGPKWLHCASCHWSGDTVEIYDKLTNLNNLEASIKRAISEGVCSAPPEQTNAEAVKIYLRNYPHRRAGMIRLWDAFSSGLVLNPHPDVVTLLQQHNLWGGFGSKFQGRMRRVLGAATKYDIKRAYETYYSKITGELPGLFPNDGFRVCRILAYHDTPGRISAFHFLGNAPGEDWIKLIGNPNGTITEGGLAMLDLLQPFEEDVLAVSNPEVALQIQRRRFIEFDDPVKLVLYNSFTKLAWRSLHANRVVFWEEALTLPLFLQARRVNNGYIFADQWFYTPSGALSNLAAGAQSLMLAEIAKRAKPWTEVFIKWLIAPTRTEAEALIALEQMALTPAERDLIISAASDNERHRLENLFGSTKRPRSAVVNGTTVMEQGNAWVVARARGEEPITDALIYIDEEMSDTLEGSSYLKGHILYRGQKLDFIDSSTEIARDILAWLSVQTNKAGLGTPRVNRKFNTQLIDIARAFSTPRVRAVSSKLGLQSDGSIVFPRFMLMNGSVREGECYHPDPRVPMGNVVAPTKRKADSRDTTSLARSAVLASFCAFASNWTGGVREVPIIPTAVIGGTGSVAQAGVRHLVNIFGLKRFELGKNETKYIDAVRNRAGQYNCPCYIERGNTISAYPASSRDQVFLNMSADEYAVIRVSENHWMSIQQQSLRQDSNPLPPVDDFVWYLADLQSRDFELPKAEFDVYGLLEDLCKWYERYLDRDQTESYEQATKMLRVSASPGTELIHLAGALVRSGFVRLSHESIKDFIFKGGVGVVVDDQSGTVLLSRSSLMAILSRRRMPMPDLTAATQDLAQRGLLLDSPLLGEGWVIPLAGWNEVLKLSGGPLKSPD